MIKSFLCLALLVFGLPGARAFSLLGPAAAYPGVPGGFGDAWEDTEDGFNPINNGAAPPYLIDPLAVGPKNLGEEYRRNTPVMYYACNASFLDYFGSNGLAAVDGAYAMLNSVFTNNLNNPAVPNTNGVDGFSASLGEFPLQAASLNYQAYGAGLLDVKSQILALMMEQLGLADAVRYTWSVHDRYQAGGAPCPYNMDYTVVMRNFDITASPLNQLQYSAYINGVLYNYQIKELCDAFPSPPTTDAYEVSTDPLAPFDVAPVASGQFGFGVDELYYGYYYTGLTRDDVAGLRYLLSSTNVLTESPAPGSVLLSSTGGGASGLGQPYTLYTSNYTAFVTAALTNDPATLSNLFPGLIIMSSSNYPVVVHTPNIVAYYTNNLALGNPAVLVLVTNGYTDSVVLHYVYTFANLFVTNSFLGKYYHTNTSAKLVTVQVTQSGVLGNGLVTNTTIKNIILTNVPSGDFYILTNLCGITNLYQLPYTNVVVTTNVIVTSSNLSGYPYSQSIIIYSTNHAYWVEPIICASSGVVGVSNNVPALYQGIKKIQFVRANYDSLVGQYFQPITNIYTMVMVTNFQAVNQTFQRVVTTPDFLFNAVDGSPGPTSGSAIIGDPYGRNINFNMANIPSGLAGPGTITPSTTITFNKVGPVYENESLYFLNGPSSAVGRSYILASFDGTTNDPVVYPDGASIQNLENQITSQISATTTVLPAGTNGISYSATISVTGGWPPYTWSVATGSQLPQGLNLDQSSGTISGIPANNPSGIQDFTIQLNDSASRTVLLNYFITF